MLHIGDKITCNGQVYNSYTEYGKLEHNMNYSDVFSELIQAAGMGCEHYSSDLFYDLEYIKKSMDNLENMVTFIGIRPCGVDSTEFIKERVNRQSCNYEPNCYIKLYRLEIIVTKERITMELLRVDEYSVRTELIG